MASLAMVRGDLNKAVRFSEIALEAAPDELFSALQLGYARMNLGSLEKAEGTFGLVIARARELAEQSLERWGLNSQGDVLGAQGDRPGALAAYRAGLEIAEALAQRDPANTQWQVDLAVSCAKHGSLVGFLRSKIAGCTCFGGGRSYTNSKMQGHCILARIGSDGLMVRLTISSEAPTCFFLADAETTEQAAALDRSSDLL